MKNYLYYIYWLIRTWPYRWSFPKYSIMDVEETIDEIVNHKKSISRFGDGEFRLLLNERGISFQKLNDEIYKKLNEVINSNLENLIIALPPTFNTVKPYRRYSKIHWLDFINQNGKKISKTILNRKKEFGNAFISRFYMDYKNKDKAVDTVAKLKNIWDNKEVLIVEGELSRLGIGNDLFNNAKKLKRIICPSMNAFSQYEKILQATKEYGKERLIILALGPTATILAHDLAKDGFWALDLGHLDVEYMWFLMKADKKVPVYGKKSAEVKEGRNIAVPKEFKEEYEKSIIFNIS